MWTAENRARYERHGLRYPTDPADDEWALGAPHIGRAKRGGRPRTTDVREVVSAILIPARHGLPVACVARQSGWLSYCLIRECSQRPDGCLTSLLPLHHAPVAVAASA